MKPKATGNRAAPISEFVVAAIVAMMGFSVALATRPEAATEAVPSEATPLPRNSEAMPPLRGMDGARPEIAADAKPDAVQTYY
jgi:hypothetical protein